MIERWFPDVQALFTDATSLLEDARGPAVARLRAAAGLIANTHCTVLVAGLCSVGKSSFVGALWGDPAMLPTAVRDCTQTNTLIRQPAKGEADRCILLSYLPLEQALDYATRDLSFYRLAALIADIQGPLGPRLDQKPPQERLRYVIQSVRKLFDERPSLFVLHEPLTEDLNKLDQFLLFLDSREYQEGQTVAAKWDDRHELLMGRRHADGRTLDVGKLLALRHVEMVRQTNVWPACTENDTPRLIDTPWIPAYHNARRADLILSRAREADILVILALPDKFDFEPWVLQILRERPELLKRTLVVFNQVDTVDSTALFSRDGFAAIYQENSDRLARLGILRENLFLSCARLPFLQSGSQDDTVRELISRLTRVLERLGKLVGGRAEGEFKQKLLSACNKADAGIESLRARLSKLTREAVLPKRAIEALNALDAISSLELDARGQAEWIQIRARMQKLRSYL